MSNCINCVFQHLYASNDVLCRLCEKEGKTKKALLAFIDHGELVPMMGGFDSVTEATNEITYFQTQSYHVVAWNELINGYVLVNK